MPRSGIGCNALLDLNTWRLNCVSWLYSQALVAAFLEENSLDGEPYAQLNVMPTQHKFWRNDKPMDASTLSRFGLTCAVLTEGRGEDLLTWYREAFLARTSAPQARAQESTASAADCGDKWQGSFAKYDHDSHSWRTHQRSLLGGFTEFSETWPRWGWMRDGACWEQTTAVPTTNESASGLWPTPVASDTGDRKSCYAQGGTPLSLAVKWPTPRASDGAKGGPNQRGSKGDLTLPSAVMKWPTPRANDAEKRGAIANDPRNGLPAAVLHFPTPTATAHKGWSKNHNRADTNDRIDYTIAREAAESGEIGRLNPTWVEWLMGWPIGWTELKPLEMGRWREWLRQHSVF